jgi:hypothetical protein
LAIKLGVKINRGKTEVTYCDVPDLVEVKKLWRQGHTPAAIKEMLKQKQQKERKNASRT